MRTITIAAYNRPDHLAILLDSLREQIRSLQDYVVVVSVDYGGDNFDEVIRVARTIDFAMFHLFQSGSNQGTNRNTYWLMQSVFEHMGAEWNVYLEDDFVLSPDAFNLVDWYIENRQLLEDCEGVSDVAAYCLCRLWDHGPPDEVFLSRSFVGWGFLMGAWQWQEWGKPAWLPKEPPRTWDTCVASHIRASGPSVCNAFPALSRVSNTGRGGTRMDREKYDRFMKNHAWNESCNEYDFKCMGIR